MKKLIILLSLTILLASCAKKIETSCPQFPIPTDNVKKKFDNLAKEDKEIWKWGNDLYILCVKLGTCPPPEEVKNDSK